MKESDEIGHHQFFAPKAKAHAKLFFFTLKCKIVDPTSEQKVDVRLVSCRKVAHPFLLLPSVSLRTIPRTLGFFLKLKIAFKLFSEKLPNKSTPSPYANHLFKII